MRFACIAIANQAPFDIETWIQVVLLGVRHSNSADRATAIISVASMRGRRLLPRLPLARGSSS